jgi:hypothetical protein
MARPLVPGSNDRLNTTYVQSSATAAASQLVSLLNAMCFLSLEITLMKMQRQPNAVPKRLLPSRPLLNVVPPRRRQSLELQHVPPPIRPLVRPPPQPQQPPSTSLPKPPPAMSAVW